MRNRRIIGYGQTIKKFIKRVKEDLKIILEEYSYERLYLNDIERREYKWSWSMKIKSNIKEYIGSSDSITSLLQSKNKLILKGYSKNKYSIESQESLNSKIKQEILF